jgi:uncharacterized membrane protein YeaQ/YmgE (transglycosylase-associated protein family)
MTAEDILVWIIIGAIAGFLAGVIVKGYGFGLVGNIIVGSLGAVIAGYLFPTIGFRIAPGVLGAIISATIGAVVLLLLIGLVRRTA